MTSNIRDFKKLLSKQKQRFVDDLVKDTQLAIGQHVYERVILRTPVLTGHARHNWVPTLNTPEQDEQEGVYGGQTTGDPITSEERRRWQAARRELRKLPVGQTLWISNNAPYIGMLEFGGYPEGPGTTNGFSKKAPHGMVGITLREVLEGVYLQLPKVMGDDGST